MRDSGRASLSQPRYTAHATAAGGVSERKPAKSPIRNANNSVICHGPFGSETYSTISILSILSLLRTCYQDYGDSRQWFSQIQFGKKIENSGGLFLCQVVFVMPRRSNGWRNAPFGELFWRNKGGAISSWPARRSWRRWSRCAADASTLQSHSTPSVECRSRSLRTILREALNWNGRTDQLDRLAQKTAQTRKGRYSCGLLLLFP